MAFICQAKLSEIFMQYLCNIIFKNHYKKMEMEKKVKKIHTLLFTSRWERVGRVRWRMGVAFKRL